MKTMKTMKKGGPKTNAKKGGSKTKTKTKKGMTMKAMKPFYDELVTGLIPSSLPPARNGFTHESNKKESNTEWYTPEWLFKALGLKFDLDPFSPGKEKASHVPAELHLTKHEDGYTMNWREAVAVSRDLLAKYKLFLRDIVEDKNISVSQFYGENNPRVWMNPPYERPVDDGEGGKKGGMEESARLFCENANGVALVFNRTDADWFQHFAREDCLLVFLDGRVKFVNGIDGSDGGSPGTGSALVAFGPECIRKLHAFAYSINPATGTPYGSAWMMVPPSEQHAQPQLGQTQSVRLADGGVIHMEQYDARIQESHRMRLLCNSAPYTVNISTSRVEKVTCPDCIANISGGAADVG